MSNNTQKKIGFISLGCDKNRVDTENMITTLSNYGFQIVSNPDVAQIIIINTCAFLQTAREEAIQTILQISALKHKSLEKLIVTGCLVMLNDEELLKPLAEVDAFVVPKDYDLLPQIIAKLYQPKLKPKLINKIHTSRILTTPKHYAYLKIADGCDNYCTYCKIPYIRGRYTSVPIQQLVDEAQKLVNNGVKELIIVAQDVTRYGEDLYKENKLVELLQKLSLIKNLQWIRLHYCYPERITDELIQEIKNNDKIVKYLDIPLQHYNSQVLKRMNRKSSSEKIDILLTKLKQNIPKITIRSTFMIGFPGETKQQYKDLCEFLKRAKLDNVGFFAYSREYGTASYNLDGQIKERVKLRRLKHIQNIQSKIANKLNKQKISSICQVICDGYNAKDGVFIGRTYSSSPDVDFYVYFISSKPVTVGQFATVKITYANKNYLFGEVL